MRRIFHPESFLPSAAVCIRRLSSAIALAFSNGPQVSLNRNMATSLALATLACAVLASSAPVFYQQFTTSFFPSCLAPAFSTSACKEKLLGRPPTVFLRRWHDKVAVPLPHSSGCCVLKLSSITQSTRNRLTVSRLRCANG